MKSLKIIPMAVFVVCLLSAEKVSAKDIYLSQCNGSYKITQGWFGSKFYYEKGAEWVQVKDAKFTDDKVFLRGWERAEPKCQPKKNVFLIRFLT